MRKKKITNIENKIVITYFSKRNIVKFSKFLNEQRNVAFFESSLGLESIFWQRVIDFLCNKYEASGAVQLNLKDYASLRAVCIYTLHAAFTMPEARNAFYAARNIFLRNTVSDSYRKHELELPDGQQLLEYIERNPSTAVEETDQFFQEVKKSNTLCLRTENNPALFYLLYFLVCFSVSGVALYFSATYIPSDKWGGAAILIPPLTIMIIAGCSFLTFQDRLSSKDSDERDRLINTGDPVKRYGAINEESDDEGDVENPRSGMTQVA